MMPIESFRTHPFYSKSIGTR